MTNVFDQIDLFLLRKVQSFADWEEETIGIDRFSIAIFCFFSSFALYCVYHLLYERADYSLDDLEAMLFWFIPTVQFLGYLVSTELIMVYWKQYVRDGRKMKEAFGNPLEAEFKDTRITMFTMAYTASLGLIFVPWHIVLLLGISCLFQSAGFYLLCTTPKPKSPSKLRKGWEKFKREMIEEEPEALPV